MQFLGCNEISKFIIVIHNLKHLCSIQNAYRTIGVDSSKRAGASINNRISSGLYQELLLNLENLQNQQKTEPKPIMVNQVN